MLSRLSQFCLLVLLFLGAGIARAEHVSEEKVFEYYLTKVDSVLRHNYLFYDSVAFSVNVRSIYIRHDSRGGLQSADTAIYLLKFSDGVSYSGEILDSTEEKDNKPPAEFDIFFPSSPGYHYNFFPNDTGGGTLAIGFEPLSEDRKSLPNGIMTFERNSYEISNLVLNYFEKKGYQRFSEVYNFGKFSNQIIPKRIVISAARSGFFENIYYRIIYEFYDYALDK